MLYIVFEMVRSGSKQRPTPYRRNSDLSTVQSRSLSDVVSNDEFNRWYRDHRCGAVIASSAAALSQCA